MRFRFERADGLPRLAWCAHLRAGEPVVSVRHGPWVETADNAFFEGSWNDDFEPRRFDIATTFIGTGARLSDGGVLFSTATNQIDRIYSIRKGDNLWLSNSMVFLLVEAGDEPDPNYPYYYGDLLGHYQTGLLRDVKTLPTRMGNRVQIHDYRNVLVRPELSLRRREKLVPSVPGNFREYEELLLKTIGGVFRNASDPARRWTYRPLHTLSSGYDSTAFAAIAKQCGSTEAVTFSTVGGASSGDSGMPIAKALNLDCTEYDLLGYRELPGCPEAEFCAACPSGNYVNLASIEAMLAGRLLLTGNGGDLFWSGRDDLNLPGLVQPWANYTHGEAMAEYRLRAGFNVFMGPLIGAIHSEALMRIARSEEMQPWALRRGHYDRTIPRRIAEQAGVPREIFATRNHGGGHTWLLKPGRMSEDSERELAAYRERWVTNPGFWRRKFWALMYRLYGANARMNKRTFLLLCGRVNPVAFRPGKIHPLWFRPIIPARYGFPTGKFRYTLQWGFERIKSRYYREA